MDRAEPFRFLASPPSLFRSRAIARTALFCLLLASLTTLAAAGTVVDATGMQVSVTGGQRIVTLGSDVTEIVYALGAGDRIVALDRGSKFPAATSSKPNVGYRRKLSAEGVAGLSPDLIIAAEDIGPPDAVDVLKSLAVPIVLVPEDNSPQGIVRKIALVAEVLGKTEEGKALAAKVTAEFDAAASLAAKVAPANRKKVIFFHGLIKLTAAGAGTSANAIIGYAGGINPMREVNGYKAASEEKLVEMAPDVILMMGDGNGGPTPEQVFAIPALSTTPAAANRALVVLDGAYMIGFGPRTAEAVRDLAEALYPEEIGTPAN
ncbi:heme/hemin ABC transporter substrate-binding protein [Aminobacter carboxidus]|uniref:ABC transporter substrate-binding protein n=1 Tax=Aminobacter carboxidus TaxID=376165 RepID=A0ABR9GKL6_9HYPH|nr:ABC transporter substrate-binding protein [Aminobacter carboxidus]MBE1204215.1 ABC transporter substrate-binding protein [Aminobacter carboxidus]